MKTISLIILILSLQTISHAASTIHYFDLLNRPATEVIPLLQPLLTEDEAISGDGYQLFIKTSKHRAEEIKQLIQAIDRAIKTFKISVTSDEYVALEEDNINASARAESGDVDIQVGKYPREKSGVSVHIDSRHTEDKSDKTQFVQVQEGKPAFISKETLHIVPIYSYVQRPNGDFIIEHSYPSSSSQDGFYVLARSADGKSVSVSIQSSSSGQRGYQKYGEEQTYVDTNIRIPLGKWFEIGGNTETHSSNETGILFKTKKNSERYNKIFLKVELTP